MFAHLLPRSSRDRDGKGLCGQGWRLPYCTVQHSVPFLEDHRKRVGPWCSVDPAAGLHGSAAAKAAVNCKVQLLALPGPPSSLSAGPLQTSFTPQFDTNRGPVNVSLLRLEDTAAHKASLKCTKTPPGVSNICGLLHMLGAGLLVCGRGCLVSPAGSRCPTPFCICTSYVGMDTWKPAGWEGSKLVDSACRCCYAAGNLSGAISRLSRFRCDLPSTV
jgi:hypothetical protein